MKSGGTYTMQIYTNNLHIDYATPGRRLKG